MYPSALSNTTYSYDLNGNILTSGNNQYAYDSTIKDKIISINGSSITYENASSLKIKSCLGLNFEYEGNRLVGVNNTNTNIFLTFKYDEKWFKKKILYNGNITKYYYSCDRLVSEINNSYYKYYQMFQLCMKRFV